jgi:hypothetical protein
MECVEDPIDIDSAVRLRREDGSGDAEIAASHARSTGPKGRQR